MDSRRFDAFTRTLSSRRSALAGLAAGVGALLGFALPEEAEAHNFLARCRRIRHPGRRGRCLRQAQEHNFRHRYCQIVAPREACSRVDCGTVRDACGAVRYCGNCGPGYACLSNGGCPLVCEARDFEAACPDFCACSDYPEVDTGDSHCVFPDPPVNICTNAPEPCQTSADCVPSRECQRVPCGSGGALEGRCVSLCG